MTFDLLRHRGPMDRRQRYRLVSTLRANYGVLLVMREAERKGEAPMTTSAIAEEAGVSLPHLATMFKKGFVEKVNPDRKATEEFRWRLAAKWRPERW